MFVKVISRWQSCKLTLCQYDIFQIYLSGIPSEYQILCIQNRPGSSQFGISSGPSLFAKVPFLVIPVHKGLISGQFFLDLYIYLEMYQVLELSDLASIYLYTTQTLISITI